MPVGPDFVCQILSRILLVFGLSSVDPAPSGRAAVAGLQVLPMYCQSTFRSVWGSHFFFVFYCHESPNVLPSTFTLPGESRQCLLPDVFQLCCRSTFKFCYQVLPMYCQSTFGPSGEVTFVFYCYESPDVLAKYLQSAWGVTSVSAARCLLMYCQSTINLPGGVTPAFCWFWTELS